VHQDLQALLALQEQDDELQALEDRMAALAPRLAKLEEARRGAESAAAEARAAVEREEARRRDFTTRADDMRRLNERAVSQLDLVRKARDANAASSQVDMSRRALADAEAASEASLQRLSTLRSAAEAADAVVADVIDSQASQRAEVEAERAEAEARVAEARRAREGMAAHVPPLVLTRYDRIRRRRRAPAVYPLRQFSCGNCDTAIPTQRRNAMIPGVSLEVCESCGVLLYRAE